MGLIKSIDHAINSMIYSVFWWMIDPLELERLYGQLADALERNLDASDPDRLVAPDRYDVSVNNTVFIKHAHAIKKLESSTRERLQRYVANKDYEVMQPRINVTLISSATVPKRKVEIRCWFSGEDEEGAQAAGKRIVLEIVEGQGIGRIWNLKSGKTYQVGRLSNADISLPYDNISKKQASIYFLSENEMTLVDEGSANGTYINDETDAIKGSRRVRPGDRIRFCKVNPIIMAIKA